MPFSELGTWLDSEDHKRQVDIVRLSLLTLVHELKSQNFLKKNTTHFLAQYSTHKPNNSLGFFRIKQTTQLPTGGQ